MSSTSLRILTALIVLLAIVFGAIGYRMSRNLLVAEPAPAPTSGPPQALAVVAVASLKAEAPVAEDQVALVPVAVLPPAHFTSLAEVIGKRPALPVEVGTTLSPRHFDLGSGLAHAIPPAHRALSVEVNEIVGVGGFLRPGDVVDVLVFLRAGPGLAQPQARVLIPATRVLAYEERRIDQPELEPGAAGTRRFRTAVLAVPEREVARVMLGMSLGEVRLALLGDDADTSAAEGPAPAQVVTLGELTRLQQARAAGPAPRRRQGIEVYRGGAHEVVDD